MYRSPIELIINEIQNRMIEDQENQVYQYVQNYIINVDKDELIKCLNFDRNQYNKGFADGIKEFAERLKPKTWRISWDTIDNLVKEMIGDETNVNQN